MPKLVIFDWDGTVVDSVSKIVACKQFLAIKYSLTVPAYEVVKSVIGLPFKEAMSLCFPAVESELLSQLMREFRELMQTDAYQAKPFPDVVSVLEALKTDGLTLVVATSKSRAELDSALKYTQLSRFFDLTCCGENFKEKPDPTMLHFILNRYGIAPEDSLMIGDTVTDIQFACNAHVPVASVTFGVHDRKVLQLRSEPVAYLDSWSEIHSLVKESCRMVLRL